MKLYTKYTKSAKKKRSAEKSKLMDNLITLLVVFGIKLQ